jgi:hypothetical protein
MKISYWNVSSEPSSTATRGLEEVGFNTKEHACSILISKTSPSFLILQ